MEQDLRGALAAYEAAGELLRITEPVNWEFEAAGVLWRLARGPAVVFENVVGYPGSLVGNVLNTRNKLAIVLGVPPEAGQERITAALHERQAPKMVTSASCQEVTYERPFGLLDHLPVPATSQFDTRTSMAL